MRVSTQFFRHALRPLRADRGVALVFTFFLLLILLASASAMAFAAWSENQMIEREENLTKAVYGAEAGGAMVENMVWNDYLNARAGIPDVIGDYQGWLNGVIPVGTTNVAVPVVQLDGMTGINTVQVRRTDSVFRTILNVNVLGMDRFNNPRRVLEHLVIQGEYSTDTNFSVMARNLECIFCHAEIDSAPRFYNTNPNRYGFFERVRVGALGDSMNRDPTGATGLIFDTRIAGTLYTQGLLTNKPTGTAMTQGEIAASDFDAYQFDPTTNYIDQDPFTGAMTQVNLVQAATIAGSLVPGANLYMDYPTVPADQTDGEIPASAPEVFPDVDGDRLVSAPDVAARWSDIQSEVGLRAPGTISGGIIRNIAIGGTYNSGSLPAGGNIASIDAAGGGVHTGNVIMYGTGGNPLMLNRTVLIDGDLIIQGVVEGEGQIYVSGNIYVTGDLTYNDGPQWGRTANGRKNLLMLRAGGSVLVNDFLTPQRAYDPTTGALLGGATGVPDIDDDTVVDEGNHRDNAVDWSYAMEQISFYNREAWTPTQQRLQKNNGTPGTPMGTTNNSTYDAAFRPIYMRMGENDPVYVFALQDGDPFGGPGRVGTYWVNVNESWRGDIRPTSYVINEDIAIGFNGERVVDAAGQLVTGGFNANGVLDTEDGNGNGILNPGEDANGNGVLDTEDLNDNGVLDIGPIIMLSDADVAAQNGVIIQLTPNAAWISDRNLKSFWINSNTARAAGAPVTINAGLHADSTIMAIARNNSRYQRASFGQFTLNGLVMGRHLSILATADTALGVTTGFRMYYDPRLVAFKTTVITNPVTIQRVAMEYMKN